jgi:hypothetical protein
LLEGRGVLATIPGATGRLPIPPAPKSGGGDIDAAGGGTIGECVQPTKINPPSTIAVSNRLDLDFLTRHLSSTPASSSDLDLHITAGSDRERARGVGLYR